MVRTANAPAGDLAERLVKDAMRGELATNSQKSWDVLAPPANPGPWLRIQVKARVVTDPTNAGQRQVSAFRSWDFESAMFVLFDSMYRLRAASLVSVDLVREHAKHVDFTASDRVFANDGLLAVGEDWTDRLRTANLWSERREPPGGIDLNDPNPRFIANPERRVCRLGQNPAPVDTVETLDELANAQTADPENTLTLTILQVATGSSGS